MNEKCPIHDNEHPAYLCPDKGNLTAQAQGREIEGWTNDKNLVRRNGWTHVHAFACESDTQAEYAASLLTNRDQSIADLEARLSQVLEENGELRDRADDHRQMYFELEEAKKRIAELEHEVTCAEADTKDALEAARVVGVKAALADEAADHVRHGSERRERFDWLARYDALPAADAAEDTWDLKCPSCGGGMDLDRAREKLHCYVCGARWPDAMLADAAEGGKG